MALKITTENLVKIFLPHNGKVFTMDELNKEVGGWIDPFKVGPVWAMSREKAKGYGLPINALASGFFEIPLYGEVLIVPPQQLPSDWTDEDDHPGISADMIDSGFLLSLQSSIAQLKMLEKNPWAGHIGVKEFFLKNFDTQPREEYTYEPPKPEDIDEVTEEFLSKVYEYIATHPLEFSKGVLLEDTLIRIRAEGKDLKQVLSIMTDMYLQTEEYEKCSVLKTLGETL